MRVPARFDRRSVLLWVVAIVAAMALAWWDWAGERVPDRHDGVADEGEDRGSSAPAAGDPITEQDVEIVTGGPADDAGAADSAADPALGVGKPTSGGGAP